jgi:lipoyl(octanoyl) transferase
LGQAGNPAHLLASAHTSSTQQIPLVRSDRGGQITYHGPGQVLAYMLIDLRRRGLMVKEFVQRIEQAVIETLAAYNLPGERHAGAPGIYLADGPLTGAKIAALGLKIRHGCSYHGVSLNVRMDLRPFDDINPCGYIGLKTVDMALAGVAADMRDVAHMLASHLLSNLPAMSPPRTDQR